MTATGLLLSKEILNSSRSSAFNWADKAITIRNRNSFVIPASHPIYDGVQEPATITNARQIIQDSVKKLFPVCSVL